MWTQVLWQYTQDLHMFKSDRVPALRRQIGHSISPLTKKLFVIDTDWQRENKYSPVECHWVISMTLQDRTHVQ